MKLNNICIYYNNNYNIVLFSVYFRKQTNFRKKVSIFLKFQVVLLLNSMINRYIQIRSLSRKSAPLVKVNSTYMKHKV